MAEISVMPFTVPFLNNACGAVYSSIPFDKVDGDS